MQKKSNLSFRRTLASLVMLLFAVGFAFAQQTVKGVVVDKTNEPVIGASVMVKGTTVGTITNYDGEYTLTIPSDAKTLVFSYIGMNSKEAPAKGGVLNIVLEDSSHDLDEVVVVGYGTVKKRDLTGAVASVGSKAIEDLPINSAAEALTGRLAGVQVTTAEGSPDAEVKIRVRGGGSITGDNSPLYLVDGFPVNSISDIPPSDIQSIDVLKDASSTAIYGARGANGVIIVTTKSAGTGKLKVSLNSTYGFKQIAKTLDVLNPYEFASWQYEQALLQNNNDISRISQYTNFFGAPGDRELYRGVEGTDWQNEIFGNTGSTWRNNVSMSGGSDKVSFNLSYNRVSDDAIMMDSKYLRDNLNFKLNAKPIDRVKIDFAARYSNTTVWGSGANEVNEKSSADSRLKNAVIYTPIPLKNLSLEETDIEEEVGSLFPPDVAVRDNFSKRYQQNFNYNGGITVEVIKGLDIRSELGYEYHTRDDHRYYGPSTFYSRNQVDGRFRDMPAVVLTNNNSSTLRNTNTISYRPKLARNHSASFLLGEETLITKSNVHTREVQGMPSFFSPEEAFKFTTQGTAISINNFYNPDNKLLSFFGRANYDYRGRYLLSVTMRADGSNLFAPGNQWGYFPSAAAAWRISDEAFMFGTNDWLDNLKLRLSFGSAGNNRIAPNQFLQTYSSSVTTWLNIANNFWSPGNKLINPDLKWETTFTRNAGLDFGVWNNRLSGTVDLYWNTTKDLLIDFPVNGSGYATQTRNIGKTSNKGVEFSINTVVVDKKNWGFDFNFNIGFNKNRVESLGGLNELVGSSAWNSQVTDDFRVRVGQPIGLMFGYVSDGMYTTDDFNLVGGKWVAKEGVVDNSSIAGGAWGPGALKLKDINGDGKIDTQDRKVIGNAMPKATGGFTLNTRYKSFDLMANFSFSLGNDIYNANKLEFTSNNNNNLRYRNMTSEMSLANRWTNVDPNTGLLSYDADRLNAINQGKSMWSPAHQFVFHSWAVEDGSFLRLNNLTFGYTVPKLAAKKVFLSNARFFFTANNLFVLTKYTGYDPEVDTRRKVPYTPGVDYSAYPKSRSYNFGFNLTY